METPVALDSAINERKRLEAELTFKRGQLEASKLYIQSAEASLQHRYAELDQWISKKAALEDIMPLIRELQQADALLKADELAARDRTSELQDKAAELASLHEELQYLDQLVEEEQRTQEHMSALDREKIDALRADLGAFESDCRTKTEQELSALQQDLSSVLQETRLLEMRLETLRESARRGREEAATAARQVQSMLPVFVGRVSQILS